MTDYDANKGLYEMVSLKEWNPEDKTALYFDLYNYEENLRTIFVVSYSGGESCWNVSRFKRPFGDFSAIGSDCYFLNPYIALYFVLYEIEDFKLSKDLITSLGLRREVIYNRHSWKIAKEHKESLLNNLDQLFPNKVIKEIYSTKNEHSITEYWHIVNDMLKNREGEYYSCPDNLKVKNKVIQVVWRK